MDTRGTRTSSTATPFTWSQVYCGCAEQAVQARKSLVKALNGHPQTEDAALCLAELTANAVLHSRSAEPGGSFTVRAHISPDRIYVEVQDQGGPWAPLATECHGRGLVLVSELTTTWGIRGGQTGRIVWFEILDSPRSISAPQTCVAVDLNSSGSHG